MLHQWPVDYCALSPPLAIKSLTKLNFNFSDYHSDLEFPHLTEPEFVTFMEVLSHSSLISLKLEIPDFLLFNQESVKYLIQLKQLQNLSLSGKLFDEGENYIDWTNSSMFLSCQFSALRTINLSKFNISRESFTVIAAATPNMTKFNYHGISSAHAAILCLIIGHYWINIESMDSCDHDRQHEPGGVATCSHNWQKPTLEEFNKVKKQFPPHPRAFQQLHYIRLSISLCSSPEICFKLLQLFQKPEKIYCVDGFYLPDPESMIGVMGLSLLPSLKSFTGYCRLPPVTMAKYLQQSTGLLSDEIVYTELRPSCDAKLFKVGPFPEQSRGIIIMSAKLPEDAPFQFIDKPVKNGVTGREAFFYDIYQSMNQNEQLTIKALSDEANVDIGAGVDGEVLPSSNKKQKLFN